MQLKIRFILAWGTRSYGSSLLLANFIHDLIDQGSNSTLEWKLDVQCSYNSYSTIS